MRGARQEIEKALARLGDVVGERLASGSWSRRWLGQRNLATFTRLTDEGVLVVLDVDRTSFSFPDSWPVEVAASLGIGFGPALDLMPLLALPLRAALVSGPDVRRILINVEGPSAVDDIATQIVTFVHARAEPLLRLFPDFASIYAQSESDRIAFEQSTDADEAGDPETVDFDTPIRLLLLASAGRVDEARDVLERFRAQPENASSDHEHQRFIRQLTRRLDAGLPAPPPVENTVAQLPGESAPLHSSWAESRNDAEAQVAARNVVRAQAKSKSVAELRDLLATEYEKRGLDVPPSSIEISASMIHTAQLPFGRARNAITALRAIKSSGSELVHLIRNDVEADPDWLVPPDRAAFRLIGQPKRYAAVDLDPLAAHWLERAFTSAPHRVGPRVLLDAWLVRDPDGAVVAFIGQQRVGTITHAAIGWFDAALGAASLFDEDPVAEARLSRSAAAERFVLEVPIPWPPGADT